MAVLEEISAVAVLEEISALLVVFMGFFGSALIRYQDIISQVAIFI